MIVGIGTDIVYIPRMEALLMRFGEKFEKRIFTIGERAAAAEKKRLSHKASFLAKRFAAKEAYVKALGTGMRGIGWQDIEVVKLANNAPGLAIKNGAVDTLHTLLAARQQEGTQANVLLSLSDDYPFATAYVVIESL